MSEVINRKIRVSQAEIDIFDRVILKLSLMSDRSRRKNACWEALRKLTMKTGNWKNARRGRPNAKNLTGLPTCPDAYMNGGVGGRVGRVRENEFPQLPCECVSA